MRTRIQSGLAVFVLLLGLVAPLSSGYLCSMTGEISRDCCCEDEPAESDRLASKDGCCLRVAVDAALPSARQVVEATTGAVPLAVVSAEVLLVPEPRDHPAVSDEVHPPPITPIFRLNCTYLI